MICRVTIAGNHDFPFLSSLVYLHHPANTPTNFKQHGIKPLYCEFKAFKLTVQSP